MNEYKNKDKIRTIIIIILLILIILLLITSCTSKLWGRIGDLFTNEGTYEIGDTSDEDVVINGSLKFDRTMATMNLGDEDLKLGFSYEKILPTTFTCYTSDAEIATCYVKDNTVVVKAKKTGFVKVYLETETNGLCYRAVSNVTIKESNRYVTLTSSVNEINVGDSLLLFYTLHDLNKENITIDLSDPSLAGLEIYDGYLKIIGKKKGKLTVTIKVNYQGHTYTASYQITIKEKTNPSKPTSYEGLKNITGDLAFSFDPNKYIYYLSVKNEVSTLSFQVNYSAFSIRYYFNDEIVDSLANLNLNVGQNVIKIIITINGTDTIYYINIYRSDYIPNDLKLTDLKVENASIDPQFDPDIDNYVVTFTDKVSVFASALNGTVTYNYNNKSYQNFNDILVSDNTTLDVIVSNNNEQKVYHLLFKKKKSDDNNLKNLSAQNAKLTPSFTSDQQNYFVNVTPDTPKISFDASLNDNKSSVKYYFNNHQVSSLHDLTLNEGDNIVEIKVTSESGIEKTYTITIHKPIISLSFTKDEYTYYIDDNYMWLPYQILFDQEKESVNLSDINIKITDYDGDYEIKDGGILLKPTRKMIDKTINVELTYLNKKATTKVKFIVKDYFLESEKYEYYLGLLSASAEKDLILNTNFFNDNIKWQETKNGIRIYSAGNPDIYIDLEFDKQKMQVESVNGKDSIKVRFSFSTEGEFDVKVKASYYQDTISDFIVKFHAQNKYVLTLDASEGYFDQFTTVYTFLVEGPFDITDYLTGYKIVDCNYYPLIGFTYENTTYDANNNIVDVQKDMTLKAIYSNEKKENITETKTLYLTDVPLFHNEKYYQEHNISKMIYPTAQGSYIMTLSNNTNKDIVIKKITLQEDSVCTNIGCINMGYIIKDLNNYYLGSNKNYSLLNTTSSLTTEKDLNMAIALKNGEQTEISILWKWLDIDDDVDTSIGNLSETKEYALTIKITYEVEKNACEDAP